MGGASREPGMSIILLCSALLFQGGLAAVPADLDAIAALIDKAGNAASDITRLECLRELGAHTDLEPKLAADIERMIHEVGRWISSDRLEYFGRPIRETDDYDFGIAEDSPLYPMTLLYRGRMLTWAILEYGGFGNRQRYDKARIRFEAAAKAFPENPIIRMYLGEALPAPKQYPPAPGAPDWAIAQREALERLTDIIQWWIDHRMQEDGQYGGGWGDDCEMWRFWVPILLGFDDPEITSAQARFSNALMSQKHMQKGYTTHVYDVEHTAEDSSDVMTPMMHLEPDNPVWKNRALRLADLFETLWTGVNERGQLQFRSTYFSVDKVDLTPARACDTVYHPRAVQPTLLLWQRTGDERLGRLFRAWMDTWVDAAACEERGKPAGILPSAIHWPDGRVGGLGADWWDPRNHGESGLYRFPSAMGLMTHTLLLTYHMTGDGKYLEPIRSMAAARLRFLEKPPEGAVARRQSDPEPGTEAWCARHMGSLSSVLSKYRLLTGKDDFDALLSRDPSPYVAFRLYGDEGRVTGALCRSRDALAVNFEGYTSEVRYTDRVLRFPSLFGRDKLFLEGKGGIQIPDTALLYSTVTGDPGDAGYFPLNAVRWLTPPRDIAALVTGSGRKRFTARVYHFGAEERPMEAELYLLAPGAYRMQLSTAATADTNAEKVLLEQAVQVTGPRTRITFALPPRTLCVLRVEAAPKADP